MPAEPKPFRIEIPQAELADLGQRLRRTRWPERETVERLVAGRPARLRQDICEYWRRGYDWRRFEAQLNAIPQFRTTIDGVPIHFLHVRSRHDHALPLLIPTAGRGRSPSS